MTVLPAHPLALRRPVVTLTVKKYSWSGSAGAKSVTPSSSIEMRTFSFCYQLCMYEAKDGDARP